MAPEILQKILGHADYSTTANIYVHTDIEELVTSAERLDGLSFMEAIQQSYLVEALFRIKSMKLSGSSRLSSPRLICIS